LARLESGIAEGTAVEFGAPLGPMGNTASYPIPVHLHFELLLGDYETQAASFGLTPRSPFDFPYVSG
ncbi:MAG: M23 family peptidase, partial [Pseudomonadota bacterium]